MFEWKLYQTAYTHVTLRKHGASPETRGAIEHGLDQSFDQYEAFWRKHIVPCTNRPQNVTWRTGISQEMERIGRLSYGIWVDLLNASDLLVAIMKGDLGDEFLTCTSAMKSGGDALQKFTDLQEAIEGPRPKKKHPTGYWLSKRLGGPNISIFSQHDWKSKWSPWREDNIGYRNFLTHEGHPPVVVVNARPMVLRREFVVRGSTVNWIGLESQYKSAPSNWQDFATVCRELHDDTIRWLNGAYNELNAALAPLLCDPAYRALWGWDPLIGPGIPPDQVYAPVVNVSLSGVTGVQTITSSTHPI